MIIMKIEQNTDETCPMWSEKILILYAWKQI